MNKYEQISEYNRQWTAIRNEIKAKQKTCESIKNEATKLLSESSAVVKADDGFSEILLDFDDKGNLGIKDDLGNRIVISWRFVKAFFEAVRELDAKMFQEPAEGTQAIQLTETHKGFGNLMLDDADMKPAMITDAEEPVIELFGTTTEHDDHKVEADINIPF